MPSCAATWVAISPSRAFGTPSRTERIVELVDDFSLVNYATLNISDKDSVSRVLATIDKANGYVFGPSELGADVGVFTCAAGVLEGDEERVGSVQERYMRDDDLSELLEPGAGGV